MTDSQTMSRALSARGAHRPRHPWPRAEGLQLAGSPTVPPMSSDRRMAGSSLLPEFMSATQLAETILARLTAVSLELPATPIATISSVTNRVDDPPCRELFDDLRDRDPRRLIAWLRDASLEPHLLTFAAEVAGDVPPDHAEEAVRALVGLLGHAKAYVREGAVYGLGKIPSQASTAALRAHLHEGREPSPSVREAIEDVLEAMG